MSDAAESLHTLSVPPAQAGMRLDKWLAEALPELSRSRLRMLIDAGLVEDEDGPAETPSRRVKEGETYLVEVPAAEPAIPQPEAIPLHVVYEDSYLIIIDKPAGMVVHPAAGNPSATLVNALLHHCHDSLSGIGGVRRPGIVHRLDKDTSGLIVAAKTDAAHRGLAEQFAAHSIDRAYRAICWGIPVPPAGTIEGNIGRSPADRKKMAVVSRGGKSALTKYQTERCFGQTAALVQCRLATGRTHQIRVHMTSIGHPLVGDAVYGRGRTARGNSTPQFAPLAAFSRQALHAYQLGFMHPETGRKILFESNFPQDINELIETLDSL